MPALRFSNYRLYFIGQGISLIGTWMQTVAEQWLIYPVLTQNKSLLGIVSAVNLIPTTLFVLFAGVLADRIDRRRVQILLQSFYAVIAGVMSVLIVTGKIEVWHVFVAAFLTGLVFAFDMPTRQALMINLVDKEHLASALSLNGGIFNAARALGPSLAGMLIASVGIAFAYFFNSISFLAVIVSLYLMKLPKHEEITTHSSFSTQLREGATYIRKTPIVLVSLLLLAILTAFTWPTNTLLPVFAHDIYKRGEVGFGMLQSAFGIGAMIGAFGFSALFHAVKRKNILLGFSLLLISVSTMLFSQVTNFYIALLVLVLGGWSASTLIGVLNTTVQMHVPDILRGRILSFYSLVLVGAMPIGAILSSVGVSVLGARETIGLCSLTFAGLSFSLLYLTRRVFYVQMKMMV